jgi:hypothetical protein
VVSEEAPLIRTTFIDKCHPAPGRNITYATIDCVTTHELAVQNKTLTGMCRHGSPTDGDWCYGMERA